METSSFTTCFEAFQDELDDIETIRDRGHLVFVHGLEGTGKTSLICRCVHFLKELPGSADLQVVDARTLSGPVGTPERRMLGLVFKICSQLMESAYFSGSQPRLARLQSVIKDVDRLKAREGLTADRVRDEVATMLWEIGLGSTDEGPLVVVILPRSANLLDVRFYAEVVQPCMMLFAELEDEDADQEHPPFGGHISVIPLRPRPLAVEDGWTFVRQRLYRETDRRESLNVQEDHIKALMTAWNGTMTIKLLVEGLVEIFEKIIRADSPRDVSYSDLASQFVLAPPSEETGSS
ncbi:ATP-binding protein [Actinomadura sp. NPDC049753]|uniref:ATP-binding protein n=1 Tax=Actinomadura sp. NPDC049753 TaxID=3154739 RepID=UPI00341E2FAB